MSLATSTNPDINGLSICALFPFCESHDDNTHLAA